jgi:hypothetical protein
MDVQLYLKNIDTNDYIQLDLFNDEKIEINLNVKDLSDISKIRTDFTQPFTIPTSPTNNTLLQYWYDADNDGTFNANVRVDAYIEVNSMPFRYGSIQLDNCKLKNGLPYSYSITFFGAGVNLSDAFGDDYLKDLDLSAYDHNYSSSVINSIGDSSINSGDIYYPLINARTYMDYGSAAAYDLKNSGNTISYKDFKPAIRELRIIEAIEAKYNISFSRDFFDRSIFYNKFFWLHKDADRLKTSSDNLLIDFTSKYTDTSGWGVSPDEIDLTANSVRLNWITGFPTGYTGSKRFNIRMRVYSASSLNYKIEIYDNGLLYDTIENLNGDTLTTLYNKTYAEDSDNHLFTFNVSSLEGNITFNTKLSLNAYTVIGIVKRELRAISPDQTTSNAILKIREQMPEMKVKEYFNSLINEFHLVINPLTFSSYYIDTLDSWYSKGNAYDISGLVDIKDITVKRPSIKKKIDFLYQQTQTILGKQYFENNQVGYGDLKATYNITGEDLKIETQFENMLFERLVDSSTATTTDLQCGFAVDITNNPVKGKPISFYRNGFEVSDPVKISGGSYSPIWHTATEDNKTFEQVTSSLNFGADNSSYFYAPIDTSLYYNFWKTYIEELYNKKTRVIQIKCKLPIRILLNLGLNDRFIISDYKYKISTIKVDLTNGDADLELFSDLGAPLDSLNNIIPLTVDSTEYTVDSELLTVDMVSVYNPVTSYTINGISLTEYNATNGEEHFEVAISANTNWTLVCSDSWITTNKTTGNKSDFIRVSIPTNSGSARSGGIEFTIGTYTFNLDINQL